MKTAIRILLVLQIPFVASCATQYLWSKTDPTEYVAMAEATTTKEELDRKGIAYLKDKERDIYYVEKNRLQKFRDYTIRTLGTPVTVTIDAATTVLVIGVALYAGQYYDEADAARVERERQNKETERLRKVLEQIEQEERADPNHVSVFPEDPWCAIS